MPIFQPRNRVQILREMVARAVARSRLAGLFRNSALFHVLAAAANEDAEQYVQMARLRKLFSIDDAQGTDLDERAAEIVPGLVRRRAALYATTTVVVSRPGTTGVVAIPAGSLFAATDAQGQIRFRTTAAGSILAGNTTSAPIAVVATIAGSRANVAAGEINALVTRIPGVTGVTNTADVDNGFDREGDPSFRARIKGFVRGLSRATVAAVESFARSVILGDGRRVLFAKLFEPVIPSGLLQLYIDDGTGAVETYDASYIGAPDTFVVTATGGEIDLFTTDRPIRDDGSFTLEIDSGSGFVTQVRDVDYSLNPSTGQIELLAASWPTGLGAGDSARAEYRFYTGLIAEVQRVIEGDPTDASTPGVRGHGVQIRVLAPQTLYQTVVAQISVLDDYDSAVVSQAVRSAIQGYINGLGIGEHVIVSELIERAMSVAGMFNFRLTSLTGSSPATDQIVLRTQVARIVSASITLT